jgi:hypothetical protein
MKESFIIAKHAPGVGNPLHLPIDEFNEYLIEISDHLSAMSGAESAPTDHRSFVEQQMKELGYG